MPKLLKARALIGWMHPDHSLRTICQHGGRSPTDPAVHAQIGSALSAAATRSVFVNPTGVCSPTPSSLAAHVAAWEALPEGVMMKAEGWSVQMVDLRKVCCFQHSVVWEHAASRVAAINQSDLATIAEIAIPVGPRQTYNCHQEQGKAAWTIYSDSPNLELMQHGVLDVKIDVAGLAAPLSFQIPSHGFGVRVRRSFLQIAELNGRHLVHDGNHRSYAFITNGIYEVPALVRSFTAYDQMNVPRGFLDPNSVMGQRPPLLTDFIDAVVACDFLEPAKKKVVTIQAMETMIPVD